MFKLQWVVQPFVANMYSACAVPAVILISRVIASYKHSSENFAQSPIAPSVVIRDIRSGNTAMFASFCRPYVAFSHFSFPPANRAFDIIKCVAIITFGFTFGNHIKNSNMCTYNLVSNNITSWIECGSLIRFGEPYTFPGKQNRLLRFRVRFFEGLISRILYLIPMSSSFTDCPEAFRLPVTGLRGHASSQRSFFIRRER